LRMSCLLRGYGRRHDDDSCFCRMRPIDGEGPSLRSDCAVPDESMATVTAMSHSEVLSRLTVGDVARRLTRRFRALRGVCPVDTMRLILFAHVAATIGIFATLTIEWVGLKHLSRATSYEQAREWARLWRYLAPLGFPSVLVVLVSGVYMATTLGVWS